MKPNFALDLSHDGIGLVHRGKGGWVLVGEVSLEHPDLASGLDLLRRKAADLESGGFSCKLIIPPSQLLFTSMTAPGPDDATRESQIREGLEGLTPYDVNDLVFDWRVDPNEAGMVHVAVVARETLEEAEGFARDHDLNPVSFVARPSGSFVGEAYFGPVQGGGAAKGARVEPDTDPVPDVMGAVPETLLHTGSEPQASADGDGRKASGKDSPPPLPELAPFPPTPEEPAQKSAPVAAAKETDAPAPDAPAPDAKDAPSASDEAPLKVAPTPPGETDAPTTEAPALPVQEAILAPEAEPDAAPATTPDTLPEGDETSSPEKVSGIVPPLSAAPPPTAEDGTDDAFTFSTRRAERAASVTPAATADEHADGALPVKPRLSLGLADTPEQPEEVAKPDIPPVSKPVHVPMTAPTVFADEISPPTSEIRAKRDKPERGGEDSDKFAKVARKGAAGLTQAADAAGKLGRKAARKIGDRRRKKGDAGGSNLPNAAIPKVNIPRNEPRDADTAIAPPPKSADTSGLSPVQRRSSKRLREAETMTVFGARQTQHIGGKPRYLGLFLVLGLLMLMAIVAIWSMFFLKDGTAWLFPERQDPFEAAIAVEPDVTAEEEELDDLDLALEDDPAFSNPGVADYEPLTPEAAQARYAATGIWQRAPDPLIDPETQDLEELYIASIDPEAGAQDAIALPDPDLTAGADMRINTAPPPPPGTTFELDGDGLVIATPEGALTPEGIMVFAGKPALVPAPRPGSTQPTVQPEETVDATPAQPRIRPRARPEGLIEGNERLQLGGRTRSELAELRPRARPTTPRAAAQAAAITAALQAADAPAANDEAGNPSTAGIIAPTKRAIATSLEPRHRPSGFNKIVARANARRADASDGSVAVAAVAPQQTVTPSLPTRASVAKQATIKNAINLRKISLIGIYGSASSRRALVRLPSGRYQKVGVGSRLDGGKVVSISATALVYKKGSRSITLEVLPFS